MFLHPHFLWLLLLPTLLAAYQLSRPAGMAGGHKFLTTCLRLAALSLVIVALARPFQQIPERADHVVAVVDCSPSMDAAALEEAAAELNSLVERAGPDHVRLVVFGDGAREVSVGDDPPTADDLAKYRSAEPGSAVAEALELAAALCPDDATGQVHLLSDGRETRGDMVAAAARLGRRGLKLTVHELGATAESPVLLCRARTPGAAAVGEAVTLTVDVECQTEGQAKLKVTDDEGEVVDGRTVSLRKGLQEVAFQVRPKQSGLRRYQVSVEGGDQTVTAGLEVNRTVIGVFETAPESPATLALRDLLGAHAEIRPLTLDDLAGDRLDGLDVLAVADTPAAELPIEIQKKIRAWVENGGGLLVSGGRNAFGPGGYARSELAAMLPLRFPQKKEVRDPSTSLAIIIDTSGSMGAEGVNLAKEVARLALKRLKPHDKAGIVEFHGAKRWAAPMQAASNAIAIERALNRLSAGGGTVMMPAIEEAYYGMLNVHTRTKHVLVLTDGGVERGAFETLLRRMGDDGIHVSTVLVGPRAGSSFLAQLAGWGRGQFYSAPSRFKLPEVIVKQPSSSLLNPFVETETELEPVLASRLTQDLELDDAPMLRGYVKTEPKDTAELLLRSELGDPVLARWHYGLGRVAILTTQLGGEWAEEFLNWPAAPDLMANLTRQLGGVSPRRTLELELNHGSAGLDLGIRALSSDPSSANAALRIEVKDADGGLVAQRDLMPIRAHQWSTRLEDLPAGDCLVEVKDAAGEKVLATAGLVVPPPVEFLRVAPDRAKLAAAAGTATDFAALAKVPTESIRTRELWPLCTAGGLVCFLLMILVRRLPTGAKPARNARAAAVLVLLATLGVLGPSSSARAQDLEEKPALTERERERIDELIEMEPNAGRQALKAYCRELARHHGDLQPLCDYLTSKKEEPQAAQLLAVAAMADGDLDLAHRTLGALIAESDVDVWALSELARVQDMRGETATALATFKRALEKAEDPGMRFAMLVRTAQLLYDEERKDAAREAIRDILADPDFDRPEGRNYCARIAGLHGDHELVEELFAPLGDDRQQMRDRLYFGEILMRLEKPTEAGEHFAEALKLARLRRDRRYALDRIVAAAREAGNLSDLMDRWLAADEMVPEQLDILVGVLGGELGRAEDLLALLERKESDTAAQTLIESDVFQQRMIMVAIEAGMSDLARRKYLDLIAENPKDFYYHLGYVRLLLMEGDRAEAEAFLRETIAATQTVGSLMSLAAAARDMALEEVALEAAAKAGTMGELAHVQTVLFRADMHRRHGEADKTLDILQALEEEIGDDAELMVPLSEAYERYGYQADVIRLIRKAYDLTKSEKLLEKLIRLMEGQQQYEQAFVLYRQLWETATEPMAAIQAQDRLLDIGSKNGKLADMAIELEERLDQGELNDRELGMLLEIYTSVNDPVSAADILLEMSQRTEGDRTELYERLVQVYMECELFGRTSAVLRKLISLNPENGDDHLQTLALIALERKNDGDAVAVLQELASRSTDGVLRDSFSASVLNMISRHEEAARVYRRALADNPDEVEAWLLWSNSLIAKAEQARRQGTAGRTASRYGRVNVPRATGMFSVLLEETADDDMFTIALDGLLNANAPQATLRGALRRVNERIALKPYKMFLYRLAADLHDELRQPKRVRRVLEQGLVIADDGRAIILRELIAMAKSAREEHEVIRYGRSLLNTAEHLPPGECIELGTLLLGKGHFSEADSAFQRVIADGDIMGVTRDIILRYENAGLYGKAGKLLRQLLVGNPFDVELLLRLGIMEEKKGNLAAAGKTYLRALDLMIGRMPRHAQKVEGPDGWNDGSRYRWSYNVDQMKVYYDLAVNGLTMSACTSESRRELLDAVQDRVRKELEELEATDAFGRTHDENPRLERLAGLMRRFGIAFHRPEYFDPMDDDLLKRYEDNEELLRNLHAERLQWGLTDNARRFMARNDQAEEDAPTLGPHLADSDKLKEILAKQELGPTQAEAVVPLLAMCGHDDLIDMVLAKVEPRQSSQGTARLTAAGLAVGRPKLIREALFNKLATTRNMSRLYSTEDIDNQIAAAWPVLNEEDRISVANQYGMIVDKMSSYRMRESRALHHYLLCEVGRGDELDPKDLSSYVKGEINGRTSEAHAWGTVMRWLLDKPEAERPDALKQLVEPHDSKTRFLGLTQFAMLLDDEDISDDLEETFVELYKPVASAEYRSRSTYLFFSGYRKNRLTEHVAKVMADRDNGEPALNRLAGSPMSEEKTLSWCKGEISKYMPRLRTDIRIIFSLYDSALRPAADVLAPEQLDQLIDADSDEPVDMLIACLLLRHAGREIEALDVLRRIAALSPDDPRAAPVRAAMPRMLARYGWDAQAAPFLRDAADDPVATTLLPFRLHEPLALLSGSAEDAVLSGTRRIHAALLTGNPAQFLQSARIFVADMRHPSLVVNARTNARLRNWPQRMTENPGGLLGMENRSQGTILDDVAAMDNGQDELGRWLSGISIVGDPRQANLCRALGKSVAHHGLTGLLRREIEDGVRLSVLNRLNLQTVTAIAAEAAEELPAGLADGMPLLIAHGQHGGAREMTALGLGCKALGLDDFARSLTRWGVALDLQSNGACRRLPDYLDTLPEDERPAALKALLPHLGINAIRKDAPGHEDVLFTALLDLGMETEAADLLDVYLRRLRLIRPRSATGGHPRPTYVRAGSTVEDPVGGVLHDAMAVALARLNRPDDYRRVLARRALLEQRGRSSRYNGVYISMSPGVGLRYQHFGSVASLSLEDHTSALPEPEQVEDITPYIDIHREVNDWLRSCGQISREHHVARICMLGKWCVERDLRERAAELLELADHNSEGMLTGRLWIADLHRLLGREEQAVAIECELLEHDLLPVSRVPTALKAVAEKEGRDRADAVAYGVASYSNHPDVLPSALRHAKTEGLKAEARDLAERERKVRTLFLTEG